MGRKIIRFLFTIAGGLIGFSLGTVIFLLATASIADASLKVVSAAKYAVPVFFTLLVATLAFIIEPRLAEDWNRAATSIEMGFRKTGLGELLGGLLGLILGLVLSYIFTPLFAAIENTGLRVALSILLYMILGSICSVVGFKIGKNRAKEGEENRRNLFFSLTGRRVSKGSREAVPKILDTSVLIDGRIIDILKTGIIEGQIIIPEYVLTELRHLSDSADPIKKAKGRRGLAILKDMQAYYGLEIYNTYSDKDWDNVEEVDIKLLRLATKLGGKVVTNDYNLIQVAEIQEIPVLNINDVVKALKTVVIPGEIIPLTISREGREDGQGVGYLDDGTMIVVEDGKKLMNMFVKVEVTSILQTASGRMIFAKPASAGQNPN